MIYEVGQLALSHDFTTNAAKARAVPERFVRDPAAGVIYACVERARAFVEVRLPAGVTGAYIPVGATLDALVAVKKVLAVAQADVIIIDPYMDETALSDFAVTAPENIPIRVLADRASRKADLPPAVQRFINSLGLNARFKLSAAINA